MPLTPTADPGHHHFEDENIYFYMDSRIVTDALQ
jgi:hypothetical protein